MTNDTQPGEPSEALPFAFNQRAFCRYEPIEKRIEEIRVLVVDDLLRDVRDISDVARSEWGRWARLVALTFFFLGAVLFLSRMPVAEHHLIVLVPLAAIIVVFASFTIASQYRWGRTVVVCLAIVYFSSAFKYP